MWLVSSATALVIFLKFSAPTLTDESSANKTERLLQTCGLEDTHGSLEFISV